MDEWQRDPRVVCRVEPSRALGRGRKRFYVILPAGAPEGEPRPVCYLLHAWAGNAFSYLGNPQIRELLLAAPHYTVLPESFRRWLINDHEGNRYEDYLIGELVPRIDELFPTIPSRAARAIGGFSMGGCAAILAAFRHPGLFGAAFSHSGAFEAARREGDPYAALRHGGRLLMPTQEEHERVWGPLDSPVRDEYDPFRLLERNRPDDLRLYLDVGLDGYPRMIDMTRSFHEALLAAGLPHEYHERPGQHDMDFMAAALPHSLAFLERAFATVTLETRHGQGPSAVPPRHSCRRREAPGRSPS